jgi:hypothetical protein
LPKVDATKDQFRIKKKNNLHLDMKQPIDPIVSTRLKPSMQASCREELSIVKSWIEKEEQ